MVAGLVIVATAAAKWLAVAKVISAIGTGLIAISPVVDAMKSNNE